MTKTLSLIAAASLVLLAAGCAKDSEKGSKDKQVAETADHEVGELGVNRLASLIDDSACAVFDANTEGTRKKHGLRTCLTAALIPAEYAASHPCHPSSHALRSKSCLSTAAGGDSRSCNRDPFRPISWKLWALVSP